MPEEAGTFFQSLSFHWYKLLVHTGGWGAEVASWQTDSWEYDNADAAASREQCTLRDPGQHQVGLVFCRSGAARQKGDEWTPSVPPSA